MQRERSPGVRKATGGCGQRRVFTFADVSAIVHFGRRRDGVFEVLR